MGHQGCGKKLSISTVRPSDSRPSNVGHLMEKVTLTSHPLTSSVPFSLKVLLLKWKLGFHHLLCHGP
jgi:hypothetical protein